MIFVSVSDISCTFSLVWLMPLIGRKSNISRDKGLQDVMTFTVFCFGGCPVILLI